MSECGNVVKGHPMTAPLQTTPAALHQVHAGPDCDAGDPVTVIVHGILGASRHWRSFMRRWTERAPEARLLAVDLRGHGRSPRGDAPHTVAACAGDILGLLRERQLSPTALVGHSFGGKVVLELARQLGGDVREVWVLDSPLGVRAGSPDPGQDQVGRLLDACGALPAPGMRREDVVSALMAGGQSEGIARWMATNLVGGFGSTELTWAHDDTVVRELLADYFALDMWPVVRDLHRSTRFHMVRGERSDRWTPLAVGQLRDAAGQGLVRVHTLRRAGHWVHVDAPGPLLDLLTA